MTAHVVLLPGLHGTAALMDGFRRQIPAEYEVTAIDYPSSLGAYPEAVALVRDSVGDSGPLLIIAESFSSPVAVLLARSCPAAVVGLVLVAGFVRPPVPRLARFLPLGLGLALLLPLARLVSGFFGSGSLAKQILAELGRTSSGVLAARARATLSVEVTPELSEIDGPVLYLRGDRDTLVGGRGVRPVLEHARNLTVSQVPATHFVLQSAPEESWERIEAWLAEAPR